MRISLRNCVLEVVLLAMGLALVAQLSLEPSAQRTWTAGGILYALAGGFLVLAALRGEWHALQWPSPSTR